MIAPSKGRFFTLLFLGLPVVCLAAASDARLTARVDRADVELGEPIYVTVTLQNVSPQPIELMPLLDPRDGLLSVSVHDGSAGSVVCLPLSLQETVEPRSTLAPHQKVSAIFPVFFGVQGWTFKVPGQYTLRARMHIEPSGEDAYDVESDQITLRVQDGSAIAQRLVNDDGASLEAGRFLVWRGGDHLTAGKALLEEVVSQQPSLTTADHIREVFAFSWASPFQNYVARKLRPADPSMALAWAARVQDETRLPSSARLSLHLTRAAALLAAKQPADAKEALSSARTLLDEHAELASQAPRLQRLQRALSDLLSLRP